MLTIAFCTDEGALNALKTQSIEVKQMVLKMKFLVKLKGTSYLHCQWIAGPSIVENFDASSIQTLLQFLQLVVQHGQGNKMVSNIYSG